VPSTPFKIEQGKFGLSLTDPGVTDACLATITQFSDFTCNVTSAQLTASPNVSDETTPATWCDPEQTTPMVGMTSYECAVSFLQDPQIVQGLSRFLFEHDTTLGWVYMGLDGDNPPKAVARVRFTAGAFGGEARVSLTAEVTMPCDGKPILCFGDSNASESVPIAPAAPMLVTLTPASVVENVPTTVTVDGMGFTPTTTIHVDGVSYPTAAYVSATQMTFEALAQSAGSQDITARNGTLESNALPLTVTVPPPPTISSLNPATHSLAAPVLTQVNGTGFDATSTVEVDSVVEPSGALVSAFEMSFTPSLPTVVGTVQVTVTTGGVTSNQQPLVVIA